MGETQWKRIYRQLRAQGLDVYSPGEHKGDCVSPYVVVKTLGSNRIQNFTSVSQEYDILMYVPKHQYSTLEEFVESVKMAMKPLEPAILPMYSQTPPFYDDTVKGHMVSMQYRNSRRM